MKGLLLPNKDDLPILGNQHQSGFPEAKINPNSIPEKSAQYKLSYGFIASTTDLFPEGYTVSFGITMHRHFADTRYENLGRSKKQLLFNCVVTLKSHISVI